MNLRRMAAIVIKELRQLRRDKLTFVMIAGVPILQLVLFGYAINTEVRRLRATIVDQSDTQGSRVLVQDLLATGVIREQSRAPDPATAVRTRSVISTNSVRVRVRTRWRVMAVPGVGLPI